MAFSKEIKNKINKKLFKKIEKYKHQNLLIYGLEEYCETYFINGLLENLYGSINIKKLEYEIDNYNKQNIIIKQSENHIEFNPQSSGTDRYALLSLIKDFGKNQMVNVVLKGNKTKFRTIIINKIDDLNYYCQASLRRNMEKYSSITNFILISNNLSKVTEPIRSRCCLVTIPKISKESKKEVLSNLFPKSKINLNRSLTENLLMIDMKNYNLGETILLEDYIKKLLQMYNKKFNVILIRSIKKLIYDLYISNFSLDTILLEITNQVNMMKIEDSLKYDIIKEIIDCNININIGKRYLIHLENLILKIFNILNV